MLPPSPGRLAVPLLCPSLGARAALSKPSQPRLCHVLTGYESSDLVCHARTSDVHQVSFRGHRPGPGSHGSGRWGHRPKTVIKEDLDSAAVKTRSRPEGLARFGLPAKLPGRLRDPSPYKSARSSGSPGSPFQDPVG